jgi:hypothetical protein
MEHIGQLMGNIAHESNNSLAAISSGPEMLEKRISQGREAAPSASSPPGKAPR